MTKFTESVKPGSLPLQAEYSQVAEELDTVQARARTGIYGPFEAAAIRQAIRPNLDFLPGGRFFDQFAHLLTTAQ